MFAYIGRQPVFYDNRRIAGYELLYRNGGGNTARILDGDAATRSVLSDAIAVFGLQQLTNKQPAYINFTRNLLLNDFAYLTEPRNIVVEVMRGVEVDGLLLEKLRALREAGYTLALEDCDGQMTFERIARIFNVVRVDFRNANYLHARNVARKLGGTRVQLLAERLETERDFNEARSMGFKLFQGYYLEKPTLISKRIPPLAASSYGQLLNELLKPVTNFDACTAIIQSDVVLSYMLSRQMKIQSGKENQASRIKRSLVLMGTEVLRRWVCLVLLRQTNVTDSDAPARAAYRRALFIEELLDHSRTGLDPRQGFLMGLFSQLDQVMGLRLEDLLTDLPLAPGMKAALLGHEENEYSLYLQYAVIYEMGNERLILPPLPLTVDKAAVDALYKQCREETDRAFDRLEGPVG